LPVFRVLEGLEKGHLAKTINWRGILVVNNRTIILRMLTPRQQNIRDSSVSTSAFAISFVLVLVYWKWLFSFLIQGVPERFLLAASIIVIVAEFASWILALLALIYVLDFLTLPLQVRFSKKQAVLALKGIQEGRFRHMLRVLVENEFDHSETSKKDLVLTVAATRRGLRNSLAPLLPSSDEF